MALKSWKKSTGPSNSRWGRFVAPRRFRVSKTPTESLKLDGRSLMRLSLVRNFKSEFCYLFGFLEIRRPHGETIFCSPG
jgi:hypothetical protein